MIGKHEETEDAAIIGNAGNEAALLALCPDLPEWPQRWQMESDDRLIGEQIVEAFKPFLWHLIQQGLALKTLKRHRDHLWMLGGEAIRRRRDAPDLKSLSVPELLSELIDEETGPLIWPRITESEQDAFDVTCRKLHKSLSGTPAATQKP